jgi:hypothetical protein
MHVVLTRRADGHSGRLWMEDNSGIGSAREVSGKSCGEVAGALALIGALAVDPKASVAPRPEPVVAPVPVPAGTGAPGTAKTDPTAPPGTGAAGPAAPVTGPAPPDTAAAGGTPPPGTEKTPEKTDTARDRAVTGRAAPVGPERPHGPVEVGAQVEVAFLADAVATGRLFVDLETGAPDRLFSPALRLALGRSLDTDRNVSAGAATLRWTEGAFEVCPVRFGLARPIALRPCAGVEAGVLQAAGSGVLAAETRSRPWAALTFGARLAWEPVRWLAIELEAGAVAPLYRESFYFQPSVTVYEAPTLAFLSRLGLGVRFP